MIIQSKAYKIAIIGDSLSVGGAERVHARLSEYFVANNHQVFNCIFLDSVTYKNSGELFNLGKIHKNSNPITRKISRFIKLKQFVEKNQFDVIIDFRMRNVFVQEFLISNLIYKKKAIFSVRSGVLNYYFPKSSFLSKLIYKNKKIVAVSRAVKDKIIDEKFAQNVTHPLNRTGDEEGARWVNGEVFTPAGFKEAFRQYAEGGWIGLGADEEWGGQAMPKMLTVLSDEMLFATNPSFMLYPLLSVGAGMALNSYASQEQKETYLPKIYSGEWSGTMCLTEPHAGTDLGIIKTKAEPNEDGTYNITGTKIFITGGDHDLAENIIHLVLAKTPDAPAGSRGISLFIVPK